MRSVVFFTLGLAEESKVIHNEQKDKPKKVRKRAPPTMGWMSWERFRCEVDCTQFPNECINEALYQRIAKKMVDDGYRDAGYVNVHVDDCWENNGTNERDASGMLVANATRFPSGMKGLGDYLHNLKLQFGLYTDIGTRTCGGYPGTMGSEEIDAQTFANWGVDYIKVDGCYAGTEDYIKGYPKFGQALQKTGRKITYSCSWPAYLGDDESKKPFKEMADAYCDTWRNWGDIENTFGSIHSIINHWGDYNQTLPWASDTYGYNDADMIMAGNNHYGKVVPLAIAKIQLAVWSIIASPMIMSNDLATVTQEYKDILLNRNMISVNQADSPTGGVLYRVAKGLTHVWGRIVEDGLVLAMFVTDDRLMVRFSFDWSKLPGVGLGTNGWLNIWTGAQMGGPVPTLFKVQGTDILFIKVFFAKLETEDGYVDDTLEDWAKELHGSDFATAISSEDGPINAEVTVSRPDAEAPRTEETIPSNATQKNKMQLRDEWLAKHKSESKPPEQEFYA